MGFLYFVKEGSPGFLLKKQSQNSIFVTMRKQAGKKTLMHAEYLILFVIWLVIFASPILLGQSSGSFNWKHVIKVWLDFTPYFLLFLINRYLLLPFLFFKGRRVLFVAVVGIFIGVFSFGMDSYRKQNNRGAELQRHPSREEQFFNRPPRVFGLEPPPPLHQPVPKRLPQYASFIIIALLMVGFDTGLKVSVRLVRAEQEQVKLEKENVETQLAFLRNQVSPHFFMNTLNNIHALVDFDKDEAKESIIRLSGLMRHLLYDSEEKLIPVRKEVEFIQNYIELMKLRFTERVTISLDLPNDLPEQSIPPLLFTSFIENAFKHGVSYNAPSFIQVVLSVAEDRLNFQISNSNFSVAALGSASGIGLKNIRQRLDLLYKDNYKLDIQNQSDIFAINLSIPL